MRRVSRGAHAATCAGNNVEAMLVYSININPLSSALQIKTLAGVGRDYLSGVHAALNIYTNIDKEKDTSFPIYLLYLWRFVL